MKRYTYFETIYCYFELMGDDTYLLYVKTSFEIMINWILYPSLVNS
jgi:hypothetical protein